MTESKINKVSESKVAAERETLKNEYRKFNGDWKKIFYTMVVYQKQAEKSDKAYLCQSLHLK